MELYAKGQLSFLILNCLLERDFYGLDIISEISNRSNGNIQLKKPSVYSNLTRMEKQKFVSSYLRSSDLGPNRKYYSITEKGRQFYAELKAYFDRNNIDVFRDFNEMEEDNAKEEEMNNTYSPAVHNISVDNFLNNKEQENSEEYQNNNDIEESDFFDFSSIDNNVNQDNNLSISNKESSEVSEVIDGNKDNNNDSIFYQNSEINKDITNKMEDNKIDEISNVKKENNTSSFLKEIHNLNNDNKGLNEIENKNVIDENQIDTSKKDDAVFLSNSDANEYNKRLYDISKEINRYKRKRSFAEDQISITVDSPLSESNEKTRANIENFKNSMLENKNKYSQERLREDEFYNRNSFNYRQKIDSLNEKSFVSNSLNENNQNNTKNESNKDDAVFITKRINSDSIERAKKIEPPRLKIITESSRDNRLPAPKRDTTIDPSHKEILSKLYSRTKDSQTEEIREDALYDYTDLKDFYKNQDISFNVYKKPIERTEHNTNKIYLIVSSIVFILASLFSMSLYLIFLKTDNLNVNTNFLYILLPSLLIIDVILKFYNYKKYRGWMPSQMLPQWQIWCYTLLSMGCIIGLNFIFGLNTTNFELFANTLVLPLAIILVLLPIRYYLKRIILVKFWK